MESGRPVGKKASKEALHVLVFGGWFMCVWMGVHVHVWMPGQAQVRN